MNRFFSAVTLVCATQAVKLAVNADEFIADNASTYYTVGQIANAAAELNDSTNDFIEAYNGAKERHVGALDNLVSFLEVSSGEIVNTYTGFGEQVTADVNALEIDIRVAEPASEPVPVLEEVEPEVLIADGFNEDGSAVIA